MNFPRLKFNPDGTTTASDESGAGINIPGWLQVYCDRLVKCNVDPAQFEIELPDGRIGRWFLAEGGYVARFKEATQ
jgi:hypothetical protein